jgi:hypothetical protein
MEANWLDPHLEPPHLTYPALMVRDILYLGGPINMIEFLKVPIGDVLGQNESIKFVTAENLKVG